MNIIGRITRDAQTSTLDSGKTVVNFSVAVNDQYRNTQGERIELTDRVGKGNPTLSLSQNRA